MQVSYREESISAGDLQYWERDRIKETANGIVTRRRGPGRILSFSSIYFRELRDAVDRAAEELATRPDEDLDYYWTARRGIPTYYAPLFLGVPRKSYLRSASLESIGEGLALYLLEDQIRHPELFGLDLFCRPLGSAPDLMMYYRRDPSRLALVEAKATEKKKVAEQLTQAVIQLIDVFKGWQNHMDLEATDAFAVATSVSRPGTFEVTILKMVFRP
jgi:hypothetical protein